jgi:hypothetical protein
MAGQRPRAEDEDLDEAWVSVDPAGGQPHVPHDRSLGFGD